MDVVDIVVVLVGAWILTAGALTAALGRAAAVRAPFRLETTCRVHHQVALSLD